MQIVLPSCEPSSPLPAVTGLPQSEKKALTDMCIGRLLMLSGCSCVVSRPSGRAYRCLCSEVEHIKTYVENRLRDSLYFLAMPTFYVSKFVYYSRVIHVVGPLWLNLATTTSLTPWNVSPLKLFLYTMWKTRCAFKSQVFCFYEIVHYRFQELFMHKSTSSVL